MSKRICKCKTTILSFVLIAFLVAFSFSGIISKAETPSSTEPVFDPLKHTEHSITSYGNGSSSGGVLTVPSLSSSYFTTDLENNAEYYMTMVVKTDNNFNISYRTNDSYLNLQINGFNSVGTGAGWKNQTFNKIRTGIRVTLFSTPNKIEIWVDGNKLIDSVYTKGGTVKPGISWSFNKPVTATDIKIWSENKPVTPPEPIISDEPQFDPQKHYEYSISNFTTGQFASDTLKVPSGKNSYFETELVPNAEYYMTLNVKTTGSINIGYRSGSGYLCINKSSYSSVGTDSGWINKKTNELSSGLRITIFSSENKVKIWVGGEKIIDADYKKGGTALPGIYWTFNSEVTVKDIKIWTELEYTSDEPKYDSDKHNLVEISGTTGGLYENGVLSVEPLKEAVFNTDLSYDSDYYMTMTVKTNKTVNIGFRKPDAFIHLQPTCYSYNGVWTDKSFPLLATGIRVTIHSQKDHIKIWVAGEKLVDSEFSKEAEALPGIYWSFEGQVVCSNITIWTEKRSSGINYGDIGNTSDKKLVPIEGASVLNELADENYNDADSVSGKIYVKDDDIATDGKVTISGVNKDKVNLYFVFSIVVLVLAATIVALIIFFFIKKIKKT